MLDFEPFSLSALQRALPYLQKNPSRCSDLSAGYLFLWQEGADARLCVRNGTFSVCQRVGEQPAFSYPFGDDPDGMVNELIAYAKEKSLPLRFFAVDEETLAAIRADGRLRPAMWACDKRWSDYLYSFEEAMTFSGKKYSGQRNHINKFKKLYGEPDLRFLGPEDREAVAAFLAEYAAEHRDGGLLERTETERTGELFTVCGPLGLLPAGLFVSGKLAAISIGEVVGDMLLIHAEKALTRYEGIYPTMYSGFVRLIAAHEGRPLALINREDDAGDPGLRTSKRQYHPVAMADKYLVHVGTPALRAGQTLSLSRGGVVLTELREGDKAVYLRLNTDAENNRWWGYDYREDMNLTGPVDENTFFDAARYDMAAGDSVNLAVRLSADGEMIGEAILWNFSPDGTAELGCRILPEYQKRGYGRAAFGAAAEYAARTLRVRVAARCFRENAASRRMIEANGFVFLREDAAYCYFAQGGGTAAPAGGETALCGG